jgi:hypothetical protein
VEPNRPNLRTLINKESAGPKDEGGDHLNKKKFNHSKVRKPVDRETSNKSSGSRGNLSSRMKYRGSNSSGQHKSFEKPVVTKSAVAEAPKNLTSEPKPESYNDYDVSDYQPSVLSKPSIDSRVVPKSKPQASLSDERERKEIKSFIKRSNPTSQKHDESIPAIDVSRISGEFVQNQVEVLDQEDYDNYGVETIFDGEDDVDPNENGREEVQSRETSILPCDPTPVSKGSSKETTVSMGKPRILSQNLSDVAKNFLSHFEVAIKSGDGQLLSDLVYDADMEGDLQLDLEWYEKKAASLLN